MNQSTTPNIEMIRQRAELLRGLRAFFDSRGFLEVQPPCLSRDCVIDAYVDPIRVDSRQLQLAGERPAHYYLQTSPELAMKRLLAAGAPSIYSLGPVFRSGENGDLHNVEFTMLEWYDVGADLQSEIKLLGELASNVLNSDGYDVRTYHEIFWDALKLDPHDDSLERIRQQVGQIDGQLSESIGNDRDLLLDVLLTHRIQPSLGVTRPLVVKNYPLSQAALARPAEDDPKCAARFELFANGIEIANGYDELLDANVLIERARDNNEKRIVAGRDALPIESSLVDAMRQGLPRCAGVALGVDRLLMVRTGESSLAKIMPFQIDFS